MTDKQAADAIINAHGLKLSPPDKQVWFQRVEVAEMLSAAIAQPVQPTPQWTPTPKNINALPDAVRQYIHALSANCDPAGMVAENTLLKDCNLGLQMMYRKAVDSAIAQPVQPAPTATKDVLESWEKWALSTGMDERNHDLCAALKEIQSSFDASEAALHQVLAAVQVYLPPDGITKDDFINRVIACVDPWPAPAKPQPVQPAAQTDAEIAALRKDAERYRWVRGQGGRTWTDGSKKKIRACGSVYDALVDDDMAPPQPAEGV